MRNRLGTGVELAGYRIESVLGEGGAGTVYLAMRPTGGHCALKVMLSEAVGDPALAERFEREARYLAALHHPSILELYEAGHTADGTPFLALQYVEGRDLAARLTRGVLDPETAVFILAQIAGALDAAHAIGLLHRDVKPGNILVADAAWPRPRAYLTDFGYAKRLADDLPALTAAGQFVGTTGYTAPEEVTAQPRDHRADVYSLTCVLYECFIGQAPLMRATPVRSLQAHLSEPRPRVSELRPDLPAELDAVIARGMAIQAAERFGDCAELVAAAASALNLAPAGVMTPSQPQQLKLVADAGPAAGCELLLDDELVLGRLSLFDGRLSGDDELSRRHARVGRNDRGALVLEDLGSANGTYVNGARIAAPHALAAGDRIEFGGTRLLVASAQAPAGPAPVAPDRLVVHLTLERSTGVLEVELPDGRRLRVAPRSR